MLLTFTAWYAIIKNDLYIDSEFLCILEYDTSAHDFFYRFLFEAVIKNEHDVISCVPASGFDFWLDVDKTILNNFMKYKNANNIDYDEHFKTNNWCASTNHCIRRNILNDFVDWYYPDCLTSIKNEHPAKFPWYHERIFFLYLLEKKIPNRRVNGLRHLHLNSHEF
jgi:hypothetical protein